MKAVRTMALAAVLGASTLALIASQASARIVCNDDGDCWHSTDTYDYPSGAGVVIHPDDWKWKEGEKHVWREHEGRGYWHGGVWVDIK
jgi:hypothetical protein